MGFAQVEGDQQLIGRSDPNKDLEFSFLQRKDREGKRIVFERPALVGMSVTRVVRANELPGLDEIHIYRIEQWIANVQYVVSIYRLIRVQTESKPVGRGGLGKGDHRLVR